jgi:predicted nucleotidyltransferase
MDFGLKSEDLSYIISVLQGVREIEKAVIFGSRAKDSYKPGSDIDNAIYGKGISVDTVAHVH